MTVTTVETWEGIAKGEPVTVVGLRGSYTFQGYTTSETGYECVWVYGGSRNTWGKRSFRAVTPDRVRTKPSGSAAPVQEELTFTG
jgi:hypothetical protein